MERSIFRLKLSEKSGLCEVPKKKGKKIVKFRTI